MRSSGNGYEVLFDTRLVEACVLLAESRENELRRLRFRKERDRLYEGGDPETREPRFERFHRRWFDRLELAEPLVAHLRASDGLRRLTRRAVVLPAARHADEGADLRDERPLAEVPRSEGDAAAAARPTLVLQLRPETLVDAETLRRLLDHELLHVADMLDPAFGYRREPLAGVAGPAAVRRATERYRVLWDCTIDGRLYRAGRLGKETMEVRRREFAAAFPERRADSSEAFWLWFIGPRPSHDALAAAACIGNAGSASGICPLCGFACAETICDPEPLAPLADLIRADFPDWRPEVGACRQCADLYAAALHSRTSASRPARPRAGPPARTTPRSSKPLTVAASRKQTSTESGSVMLTSAISLLHR